MKHVFYNVALAAVALTAFSTQALAQINQTTYWNFDQFVKTGENVAFQNAPINYGGLYIAGHSATAAAAIAAANKENEAVFGDYTYFTNYGLKLPGAYTSKIATKASDITKDAIAFDAGCAGTLYIHASGTAANRGIAIYFNGTEVKTATGGTTDAQTTTVTNSEAGTYYITAVNACNIYAVKFVPSEEQASTKDITLSEYGLSTFSDTHAWAVPEGLEAYYARAIKNDGEDIKLTLVKTDVIPACTGVILRGTVNGKYTLNSKDCGSFVTSKGASNLNISYALRPVITDYALEKNSLGTEKSDFNCYLLGANEGNAVFAPASAGTISSGKAYYCTIGSSDEFAKSQSSASPAKSISINFGGTTGLKDIFAEMDKAKGQMYNLSGQKVDASYKGMVIVNGKKFMNK